MAVFCIGIRFTEIVMQELIAKIRARAQAENLPYAGNVTPKEAWRLFSRHQAILVDVRSSEELKFVGRVPGSRHVPWTNGLELLPNPNFLNDLEEKAGKDKVVLILCRSGRRSVSAATLATQAGFSCVFNVLEGFEGEMDEDQQRGNINGWRMEGLPWVQD